MLLAKALSKNHTVSYVDLDVSSSSFSEFSGKTFSENSMQIKDNKIQPFVWVHNENCNAIEVVCASMLVGSNKSIVGEGNRQFISDILNYSDFTGEILICDAPAGLGPIYETATKILYDTNIHLGDFIISVPSQRQALEKILEYTTKRGNVLGVITNFSDFECPNCGNHYNIFGKEIAEQLSQKYNVDFIGSIPISLDFSRKSNGGILPVEIPDEFKDILYKTITKIENSQIYKKKKINTRSIRDKIANQISKILIQLFVKSNEMLNFQEISKDFPEQNSVKLHILDEHNKKMNTMHLKMTQTELKILKNNEKSTFEIFLQFRTLARIICGKWKADDNQLYDYSAIDAWRNNDAIITGDGSTQKMAEFFQKLLSDEVVKSVLFSKADILKGWI